MDRKLCLVAASLALLASCDDDSCFNGNCDNTGGSGGGPTTSAGVIILTEDNFVEAVREAWFAMEAAAAAPAFVVTTGIGDTSGGVAAIGGPSAKAMRPVVALDPFGPTVYNCPVSGTFTISGDVADPNTVTPGDFASYVSSACDSGTGWTVDGTHRIDIDSIDGDPNSGLFAQGQTLTLDGFRAQGSTTTFEWNGDHSSVIDTQSGSRVETTFSGGSLVVRESGITVSIGNFTGFESIDLGGQLPNTVDAQGEANSTVVPGAYGFSTVEVVRWYSGEVPFDGILEIYGANGGTARVAATNPGECHVQLDANGNTNHEVSIPMTWDEFFSLSH